MSTSRSHIAAAARAKRSAECEIGECPVVDVAVDVERGRHEEALTPARVAALEVMTSMRLGDGRWIAIRATFRKCSARGQDQSVY